MLGAVQLGKAEVEAWSRPLFEAFVAGAWLLHWTADTLYWVAKPTVHTEQDRGARRLHHDRYAALESDVENLYFWHGVLVPAFVVMQPEWITAQHILTESNVEVRRVMVERMGHDRFLLETASRPIHEDSVGALYRIDMPNDEPLVLVHVTNRSPEPDGSFRRYFLRVPPTITRARQAVAWTFDIPEREYRPTTET